MPAIPSGFAPFPAAILRPKRLIPCQRLSPRPLSVCVAVSTRFNPHPAHKILIFSIPLKTNSVQKIFKKIFIQLVTFAYFCD